MSLPQPTTLLNLYTNATDTGSANKTITTNGSVTYTTIAGRQCAYFDNIVSPYKNNITISYSNQNYTSVAFWIYVIDNGNNYYGFAIQSEPVGNYSSSLNCYFTSGNIQMTKAAGINVTYDYVGKWVHLVYTFNNVMFQGCVYANGQLIGSSTGGSALPANQSLITLGCSENNGGLKGYISNFAVYNTVLTPTQVRALYNPAVLYAPTLLLRAINYSGSGSWFDESGMGNNASLETGTISKNVQGNGIVLNGSTSWLISNIVLGTPYSPVYWSFNVWYKNTTNNVASNASIFTQLFKTPQRYMTFSYGGNDSNGNTLTAKISYIIESNPWANATTVNLVKNQWINMQCSWDGTNFKTYVNGILIGTVANSIPSIDSGLSYAIGRRWDANNFVTGEIGEIRVYNYPITQAQVTTDYNASYNTFNYVPINIPGCQIWLDAADPAGTGVSPSTATNVSTWVDKSGSSNSAAALTGTVQYQPAILNSLGSIYFSGANLLSPLSFGTTTPLTFFIVARSSSGAGFNSAIGINSYNGQRPNMLNLYQSSSNWWWFSGGTGATDGNTSTLQLSTSRFDINADYWQPGQTQVNINGTSYTLSTSSPASLYAGGKLIIGSTTNGGTSQNEFWNGYISEVILYNRTLSITERQVIEGYLAWKWGIQTQLPVGHPYYSVQPSPYLATSAAFWVDATDPLNTGVAPANAASVSVWADKSGNGRNLGQIGTQTVPTFATNQINSLPAINFTNSSSLNTSSSTSTFQKSATVTVFWVGKVQSTSSSWGTLWGHFTNHDGDIQLRRITNTMNISWHTNNDNTTRATAISGAPVMYTCTMLNGTDLYIQQVTTTGTTSSSFTQTKSITAGAAPVYIGQSTSASELIQSYVGEVIYYQSLLSPLSIQRIEGYLAWKWGLNTYLPTTHPYYSVNPNTVSYTAPTAITALSISSLTSTGLQLSWTGGVGATSYNYTVNGSSASLLGVTIIDNGLIAKNALFSGLVAGTTYVISVIAINAQGSTSYTYTPSDLTTKLWLDGADPNVTGTAPAVNSTLTIWKDKSVNAVIPTIGGISTGLTFKGTTTGIQFGGSSYLNLPNGTLPYGDSDFTYFIVYNSQARTNFMSLVNLGYDTTVNLILIYLNNNTIELRNDAPGAYSTTSLASTSTNQITMAVVTRSRTGITITRNATTTAFTSKTATLNTGTTYNIIGANYQYNNTFSGIYCELLVYQGELLTVTRQLIEGYLALKWGFKSSLPSTHPYSSNNSLGSNPSGSMVTTPPAAPSSLYQTGTSPTEFTINWIQGTGASSYTYSLTDPSGNLTSSPASSTTTTATFTGLQFGTAYSVIITSVGSTGLTTASSTFSAMTLPSAPSSLVFTNVTSTSFQLSWSGGIGATSYTYTLTDSSGNLTTTNTSSLLQTATFTGLIAGNTYAVVITAKNSIGSISSPDSSPLALTGKQYWFDASTLTDASGANIASWPNAVPGSPYSFSKNGSYTFPTLSKAALNGLSVATFGTSNSINLSPVYETKSITNQSFFAVSRQTGGTNKAVFYSANYNQIYPYSNDGYKDVMYMSGEPNILNGTILSNTSWDLFSITRNNATRFLNMYLNGTPLFRYTNVVSNPIQQLNINGYSNQFGNSQIAEIIFFNTNLSDYQRQSIEGYLAWKWGLQATLPATHPYSTTNKTANSPSFYSVTTYPGAPSSISQTATLSSGFTINWTAGAGTSSYSYSLTDTSGNLTTTATFNTSISATFTGLTPGMAYAVIISSVGSTGLTSPSSTFSALTAPSIPSYLTVTNQISTGFQLSWSGGTGATSYTYTVTDASGIITTTNTSSILKTATFTGLSAGNRYNVVITAKNSAGSSSSPDYNANLTSGKQLWFDASKLTDASGATIASWPNTTGATYSLVASPGKTFPTLAKSALNSLAVATFTTANSLLISPSYTATTSMTSEQSFFAVSRQTGVTNGAVFGASDNTDYYPYYNGTKQAMNLSGSPNTLIQPLWTTTNQNNNSWLKTSSVNFTAVSPTSITGTNVSGWSALIYSSTSYTGPCYMSFTVTSNSTVVVGGLTDNLNPTAWNPRQGFIIDSGGAQVIMNGAQFGPGYSFTLASTIFTIMYDGTNITWYMTDSTGNTATRASTARAVGLPLYAAIATGSNTGSFQVTNILFGSIHVPPVSNTSWDLVSITRNSSSLLNMYFNGLLITYFTNLTSNPMRNLQINGYNGNNQLGTAQVAELLYFNSSLSTEDRQGIEGYLAWKWGLQASLPVGHPYALTTTVSIPPGAPTSLSQTAGSSTAFTINWTAGAGASSYRYLLTDTGGNIITTASSFTATSATFTSLTGGMVYSVVITSVSSIGLTNPSSTFTGLTAPSTPVSVTFTSVTDTTFQVNWLGGGAATSYTYTLRDSSGNLLTPTIINNGVLSKNAIVSGLTAGKIYSITITATNIVNSSTSSSFSVTMRPAPATSPIQTAVTNTSFKISWSGGSAATSFSFTLNGLPTTPATAVASPVTFTGLTASTAYALVILSTNSAGSTNSATFYFSTTYTQFSPSTFSNIQLWFDASSLTDASGATIAAWPNSAGTSYSLVANSQMGKTFPTLSKSVLNGLSVATFTVTNSLLISPSYSTDNDMTKNQAFFAVSRQISAPYGVVFGSSDYNDYYPYSGGYKQVMSLSGKPSVLNQGPVSNSTWDLISITDASGILNMRSNGSLLSNFTNLPANPMHNLQINGYNGVTSSFASSQVAELIFYNKVISSYHRQVIEGYLAWKWQLQATLPITHVHYTYPPTPYNLFSSPAAVTSISQNIALTSSTSFTINWSGGAGATSFSYTIGGLEVLASSSTLTSATFTGLTGGTYYTITVNSVNPADTVIGPSFTAITSPSPASSFTLISVYAYGFTVRWSGAQGADYFTYTLNGIAAVPTSYTLNSATFSGLQPVTPYSLIVTSINQGGSTASSAFAITTTPTPPISFTFSNITTTSITIGWSGGYGATSYKYRINDAFITPSTDNGITAKNISFTGLIPGRTYFLVVQAILGLSVVPSEVIPVSIPPTKPLNLQVTAITQTGFTLSWTAGDTPLKYVYTLNGIETVASIDNGLTTKTATFTGLTPGGTFAVVVGAMTNAYLINSQAVNITLAASNPGVLEFPGTTSTSFEVRWTGGVGATSYMYTLNGVNNAIPTLDNGLTEKLIMFTGLTPATTYTVKVTAINANGSAASLTTSILLLPTKATSLQITNISETSFKVSWSGVTGATSYLYTLNDIYSVPSSDIGMVGNYAVFTNLKPGSSYVVVVLATVSSGSNPSYPVSVTLPPTQPLNLTYYIASIDTIRISWTEAVGARSYIYRLNGVIVTPSLDKGLTNQYAILNVEASKNYSMTVTAVTGTYQIQSSPLAFSIGSSPLTLGKKTIVYVYTNKYPFSFGEFVRGLLYVLNFALKNRLVVRVNLENTALMNYLIVDNYRLPPESQPKVYYNNSDTKVLMDDLIAFKDSIDPILLVTTDAAVHRNEIDSLAMLEFNKLIQFVPTMYSMVNDRLKRDLINSVVPPSYTDDYSVLNMYLKDCSLNRLQVSSLADQVRSTLNQKTNYIVISNSSFIRTTLTEFLGGFHVLGTTVVDSMDSLESSIVDFILVSRSKKIYTFSEYNSKVRKAEYNVQESTSLRTETISEVYYTTSRFAGIFPESNFADGTTETATFSCPSGLIEDSSGNIFVADTMNNSIRLIQPNGFITTYAGDVKQASGRADGPHTNARFFGPTGLTMDHIGNTYVVDAINGLIRKIAPDGTVTTLAGSTAGFQDGQGSSAKFSFLYNSSV